TLTLSLSLTTYYHLPFSIPPTLPTEISPLSLHDALPISPGSRGRKPKKARFFAGEGRSVGSDEAALGGQHRQLEAIGRAHLVEQDRKSTRLNSSHEWISYAVFCLKKKKRTPKRE